MNFAYIYCRVSTGRQGEEGTSLSSQAAMCRQMAEELGLTLGTATNCDEPGVFLDARSAYKLSLSERPGGHALLSHAKAGDTIIMYDISRGWRSTFDFSKSVQRWVDSGINLRFVSYPSLDLTTANGRLTASVLAAYAEWKSAIIGERVREYHAARKQGLLLPTKKSQKTNRPKVADAVSRAVVQLTYAEPNKPAADCRPDFSAIYGYVRVSTDAQTVMSQVRPVKAYIDRQLDHDDNLLPGDVYRDEGVSALKVNFADRPGAKELLERLSPGDHIVFLRPARAFRTVRDMINTVDMLHEIGVTIHLAEGGMKSGDLNFQLQMQIMTLMAQLESEEISRRVKDANAFLREHGFPPAVPQMTPRWLKIVKIDESHRTLVPDEEYVAIMKEYKRLREEEGLSNYSATRRIEEWQAALEYRFPVPVGGMQGIVAKRMVRSEISARPFARLRQKRFREAVEAASNDDLVMPRFPPGHCSTMLKSLARYEKFLEILNREGVESTAKATQA